MAKPLTEVDIQTRTARRRLGPGVYWRGIDSGVHLGYRRAALGGVWLVRWRHGAGYRRELLGDADDEIATGTLDFDSALRKARETVELVRARQAVERSGPIATVGTAVESYIKQRDAREIRRVGRPIRSDASRRLARYIVGREKVGRRIGISPAAVAAIELHKLTERDLKLWRESLPTQMKTTTRQRLFNDFKAALNAAYVENRDALPPTLPAVIKHGFRLAHEGDDAEPVARDNQILTNDQIAKIISAAKDIDGFGGDLFRFVLVMAATGARFSQVARIQVGGVQPDKARILVPVSRKGKGSKNHATPVPVGEDVLEHLALVVTGRPVEAPLLERWRSVQVEGGGWKPATRGPWQSASELRRPWERIRTAADLPAVIPYALRHSSIVRGIRANLPLRLVAALHDTSTAMIEKHYSKFIATGLEDMARAAIVPLIGGGDG